MHPDKWFASQISLRGFEYERTVLRMGVNPTHAGEHEAPPRISDRLCDPNPVGARRRLPHSPSAIRWVAVLLCGFLANRDACGTEPSWLVPAGKAQVACKEVQTADGPCVVMENGFLRVVVTTARGGRIESFLHKRSGQELTMPLAETVPGGLLSDHIWQQDYWRGDWYRAPYTPKIVEQSATAATVDVVSPAGRNWTGLSFAKRLTLRRDRSALEVEYTISADDKVASRCRPDLHFAQALAGRGNVFLPSEAGVIARPLSTETESWVWDPSRGWVGYVNEAGTGLGATFDYRRVRYLRTSQSPAMTMEWIFRKTECKPGGGEKTPVHLAAFGGLKEISAVGERLAVDLRVAAPRGRSAKVELAFAPFQSFKGKLSLSVRAMPDGPPVPALERNLSFDADRPSELTSTVKLEGQGNWIVAGIIQADGMPDLHFEKPVIVPQGLGAYAMSAEAARTPEFPDMPTWQRFHPIDFNFTSKAIPTPHREWAPRWAGGRPRVLALMAQGSERTVVEMMQRFDMDITCSFLEDSTYYVLGDSVRGLKMGSLQEHLDKTVEQEFDAIVFSTSDAWPLLTTNARNRILAMAQNGAGLVLLQRGAPPAELKEFMPLEFFGYDHATGRYTLTTNSPPILTALPFEAMPISFYSNGSRPRTRPDGSPMGQVLLHAVYNGANRGPLIAISEIGKGRLVQAQTEGWLVPFHGKFTTIHDPNVTAPPYDYWEYHYAMTARLIYWAARKESPVALTEVACSADEVKVTLDSQLGGPASMDVTLRDKFGEVLGKERVPIQIQTGTGQTFAWRGAGGVRDAAHMADVIVSNERGVLAFGAGVFPPGAARITKLAPEKAVFQRAEPATILASVTNGIPPGAMVRAQLFDGHGRHVASADAPVAAETKLTLPLERVMTPRYLVRATLFAGDRVLDQAGCEGEVFAVREPERLKIFFWGGIGGSVPGNLLTEGYRHYLDMGMNANWLGEGPLGADRPFLQKLDLPYTRALVGMSSAGGVTKQQAATNQVEHGNILTSPAACDKYRETGIERGTKYRHEDVLVYSCADENRASGKDVDFSEDGKRALRKWLQEACYKTIEELNREWGASYRSFDEVVAMTEDEAKEHLKSAKTCAPWLDQRLYMPWAAARLAKCVTDGVLSVDPTAVVGESGSQEPNVYGTDRNWWHMARSYTGLGAYGGVQTQEQESYNPSMIRYSWSGYGKPNPLNRAQFYNILGRFDRGIAIFSARTHIDPDYTLPECGRDVRAVALELQRGIGQMLVSAQPWRDPVYILSSYSSVPGAYILGLNDFASNSRMTATRLLPDLGVHFQSISYEQLATGHLDTIDCRVLVLPATVAMSPDEIDAVRRWVKNGGTLVADMKTALMTDHGRLYPKAELDDVFGIDRTNAEAIDTDKDSPWTGHDNEGRPVLKLKTVERGITGSAKPLGQVTGPRGTVPIVYANQFGKGRAYYFAADLFGAYSAANEKSGDPGVVAQIQFIQGLFEKILGEAGVQPQIDVRLRDPQTGRDEGRCPWVWMKMKHAGQTRYVTVFRHYGVMDNALPDIPVTLDLAQGGVIYDVVAGKPLGRGTSVPLRMINSTGRVFAILPSEVLAVEVTPARPKAKLGEDFVIACEVKVASGEADPRVLRLDVTDPEGKPCRAYTTDLICSGGRVTAKIPFALNDSPGNWTVRVTDVASGASKIVKITVL